VLIFFPCNLAILLAGATLCEGVPSWFCNGWIECTCVEFITWEPWWFQMSNHVRRVVCVVTPLAARSEVEWSYLFFTYVNVSRQFWRVPSILLSPLRFGCHPDRPRVSSRNICLWIYIYIYEGWWYPNWIKLEGCAGEFLDNLFGAKTRVVVRVCVCACASINQSMDMKVMIHSMTVMMWCQSVCRQCYCIYWWFFIKFILVIDDAHDEF